MRHGCKYNNHTEVAEQNLINRQGKVTQEKFGNDVKDYKMRRRAQAVMNQDESESVVTVTLLLWQP